MADLGTVGNANVELRARKDKLRGDLKNAERDSRSAGRRAGAAFASGFNARAAALKGAIAGIFTAAAFKSFLNGAEKAIDKLDEIAKTADSIGITTDALQELRVAADLSGVSAGELDAGLRRFSRAVAEAGDGVAEYAENFKALGIEVRNSDGSLKSIDGLISEVAEKFSKMDDATRKAALAQELFGRGGLVMVNLLNAGAAGIEEMRKQARELGIVIDESLIRKSVIAKDQLTLLNKVIDAELTTALANAAPLLVDFVRLIAAITTAAADAYQGLRLLFDLPVGDTQIRRFQISTQLKELDAQIAETTKGLETFLQTGKSQEEVALPFASADAAPTDQAVVDKAFADAQAKIDAINAKKLELQQELATLGSTPLVEPPASTKDPFEFTPTGGTGKGTSEIDKKREAFQSLTEALQESIEAELHEQTIIDAKIQTIGDEALARELLLEKVRQNVQAAEIAKVAQEAGLDLQSQEVQKAMELAGALGEVTEARIRDNANLEERTRLLKEAEEKERQVADALEGMGNQLIQTAMSGGDLKVVLGEIIVQLIEMALRTAFLSGPTGTGSGGLGGIFGSIISGVVGGIGGGTSFGGPVGGFADGGFAPRGTMAIVGERGPELGVFGQNARIFSNEDLKSIMTQPAPTASREVNVQFNVSTPDVGGFRRSQGQMAAELRQTIDKANRQI